MKIASANALNIHIKMSDMLAADFRCPSFLSVPHNGETNTKAPIRHANIKTAKIM